MKSARVLMVRDRLYCVLAWPVLFVLDLGIGWSGVQTWKVVRSHSRAELAEIWNRRINNARPVNSTMRTPTGNMDCDDGLCFHVSCKRCNRSGGPSPYGGDYVMPSTSMGHRKLDALWCLERHIGADVVLEDILDAEYIEDE